MAYIVTCPHCNNSFDPGESMREQVQKELRAQMVDWQKKKDNDFKKKESEYLQALEQQKNEAEKSLQSERKKLQEELRESIGKTISADYENRLILLQQSVNDNEEKLKDARKKELTFLQKEKELQNKEAELEIRLQEEKIKLQEELQENIRKTISADYENKLTVLQQSVADNEEKLKESRKKELEFLQKEKELQNKEAELELEVQRKLLEEREQLKEQLQNEEKEKARLKEETHQLRVRELEKQLDDQKKLAEEMRRRAEQGSMQLQGEVQELMLEEILRTHFPIDIIEEVGKGVRGADCIHTVRNTFGMEAGKIIYESKRTKEFANEWIEKLKADMRKLGADVAVLVTQALPKDIERFGEKDGIYICSFSEVKSLAAVLRNALLKIFEARKSQENKGDKMVMLYDYLTGSEFVEQWKAIKEGFLTMKLSIQRERDAMEKLWKAREKQLEKVLLNAAHIRGSIEGIAGSDAVDLKLIEDENIMLEE